jgi:hypothetical protein
MGSLDPTVFTVLAVVSAGVAAYNLYQAVQKQEQAKQDAAQEASEKEIQEAVIFTLDELIVNVTDLISRLKEQHLLSVKALLADDYAVRPRHVFALVNLEDPDSEWDQVLSRMHKFKPQAKKDLARVCPTREYFE